MDDSEKTSLAGRTLGHYKISSAIGAGGMGEVYRATDTKLGREIALKVLPHSVASDPDRLARFQREARTVAALNHPNVVTLYSVEESEGVHFLTMELIEGQSLDHLIAGSGLAVEQMVEIAGALAEALTAAHEKGIVHRDLKPANVMLTSDGRVKVLDFGLAKDVSAAASDGATLASGGHTEIGVVMGTPAYMSPEQVSGRPLDHRSDIFSLGVVLHEMATGERPFQGSSSAELISSILRDQPPPVTDMRPEVPSDLARVIRRCLEKDPRHRLQTARDVSNEFRDLARTLNHPTPAAVSSTRVAAIAPDSSASRRQDGFWVAVLPFRYTGGNAELAALADGLTDDILTGLSKFSYLRVIARSSSSRYTGQSVDIRIAGNELGARYVMEGTLRQAGGKLRLAVQLVDSATGAHLWAENFERVFSPEKLFDLQDNLVPRIVATVADQHGVLPHSMSEVLRQRGNIKFTPHEAVLRAFGYFERMTADEHAEVRAILEKAAAEAPSQSDCLAMLSNLYWHEYALGLNPLPDSLRRAHAAGRRAVEAAPSNHLGHHVLAACLFFQKDILGFRREAERCMELNPLDSSTTAFMGILLAYAGEWERGCAIVERASELNPNHPGWYYFPLFLNAYRKGDYTAALKFAAKIDLPGYQLTFAARAAVLGQLGDVKGANDQLTQLRALQPDAAITVRQELCKWHDPDLVQHWIEGLRKAGLDIKDADSPSPSPASATKTITGDLASGSMTQRTASGATRADEGFWVAVLPFKCTGSGTDLRSLAEGLTDEIITGLSRFSYLRVIARGSTVRFSSESGDVRAIGKELGARYVMEGSLRQAGAKLRLSVQLTDTISGTHLWAETYERAFAPDAIFDLQDDLVPRVVATVADQYGVLPRSMSDVLRGKRDDAFTPHEAVLRTFSYFARITAEEHSAVRTILECAVREAPDHADSWAMLSMIYRGEFAQGFNTQPNPLDRALSAARRAVEISSTHALGHYALATVYFFRKEMIPFRVEADRALMLNPLDASVKAYLGLLIAAAGEWDRGCQMVEHAMQLNPNCPGYFYFARCCNAYRLGAYEEVLEAAAQINMPSYFHVPALRAAALGQLGRAQEARKAGQHVLALRPDFAATARQEYAKWYSPELIEQIIDGLRKAGMEIPDETAMAQH
jgi:TolB-like protein/predicted Ser/Thr protein kinase